MKLQDEQERARRTRPGVVWLRIDEPALDEEESKHLINKIIRKVRQG
ncbi:hypothetical protein OG792_21845 [Micromonospora sp. NBC_01699]|nr:hypothetical protein [Micromonospora sp. NBC_01699]